MAGQSMESLANNNNINGNNIPPGAEVRTLFVSGLPPDATERELYLLFRTCHGFENALLRHGKTGKSTTPVGFVTFETKADADEARRTLNGVRFDQHAPYNVRLEIARSTTKFTKPKQPSPPLLHPAASTNAFPGAAAVLSNAAATSQQFLSAHALPTSQDLVNAAACIDPHGIPHAYLDQAAHAQLLLSMSPHLAPAQPFFITNPIPIPAGPTITSPAAAALFQNTNGFAHLSAAAQLASAQTAQLSALMNSANGACSTLFIANLSPSVSEDELKNVSYYYYYYDFLVIINILILINIYWCHCN